MKLHSFDLFSRKEHSPMKMRLLCTAMLIVLLTSLIPAALAESRLDHYAIASFGQNYAVYSGPGEYYYRANSGKALYGGGSARVYGDQWGLPDRLYQKWSGKHDRYAGQRELHPDL